jgi:hypothetical protein
MAESVTEIKEVPTIISISKEALRELLIEVAGQARRMTPLEERRYKEELEAEQRRARMICELGQAEEIALKLKRSSCTHKRSKDEGLSVPKGDASGVWTTQAQLHGNDTVSLICMRCSTVWSWRADARLREYFNNAEHQMLGFAPPPDNEPGVTVS